MDPGPTNAYVFNTELIQINTNSELILPTSVTDRQPHLRAVRYNNTYLHAVRWPNIELHLVFKENVSND